jgi:chromatin assembly factor 1 subunit B
MIEAEDSPPFVVKVHLSRADGQSLESEVIAKEVWKPYKILRGHLQDVSDICWSPDGQKILSGSVDNMVYVWDLHKGQKLVKIVNEHKGFVQGVTWDPCDKYLATLSADRNMRIIDSNSGRTVYRVHKLSLEDGKTTRLFYDDTLRSFCRRLTFSPGGEFLIAPSGIMELNEDNDNEDSNKYINTTYIFERNSLKK